MLIPRSSMGLKTPLSIANSVGVIDAGFSGSLKFVVGSTSESKYTIETGSQLCQIVAPDIRPIVVNLVDNLENPSARQTCGFGSTGMGRAGAPAPWEAPTFSAGETSRAFRKGPCLERGNLGDTSGEHRRKIPEKKSRRTTWSLTEWQQWASRAPQVMVAKD